MTALTAPLAPVETDRRRSILFGLFFVSGFCGLVYQVVWLRMAFAHFGIVTPVLSVVVSVFMAGLGLGAVVAGRWAESFCRARRISPATLYGLAELGIAAGALLVPVQMRWSEGLLLQAGGAETASYLALSAFAITVAILPSCFLMGTTYPLMMSFMRSTASRDERSFSFLYRANVIGAAAGTLGSAFVLIELLGFHATSLVAAILNVAIALVSFGLARETGIATGRGSETDIAKRRVGETSAAWPNVVLLATGFCSLAMEVVWTRAFTIVLQTTIYAFALILAVYLLATALGAAAYRRRAQLGTVPSDSALLIAAALAATLPVILNDARLYANAAVVLLSIAPFCYVLGLLTPKLIDTASAGNPDRAGRSYACNIVGSILGPLVAGYWLVTAFDPSTCMLILTIPILALAGWSVLRSPRQRTLLLPMGLAGAAAALAFGAFVSRSYESEIARSEPRLVYRDHAATAIAYGQGMDKHLLVNGVGITNLTPITKVMAHLPLALHNGARDGLVICFGMGTTARSMASWGIETTAVDLTSSVIAAFPYFHDDAATVSANPKVHFVVDDGRRFLSRSDRSFDVIVIDPPPPVVAAGSSLLYSREMYEVVKRRLRPDGILQQWFPHGDDAISQAVARTLVQSFPYVVAYRSVEGWGIHYLASMQPIPDISAETLVGRLPKTARQDFVEWQAPNVTALSFASDILSQRMPPSAVTPDPHGLPIISDDKPYNEYFFLRSALHRLNPKGVTGVAP